MIKFNEVFHEGLRAIEMANDHISLTTIPLLGGKIVTLINKKSGFNFIYKNKNVKNHLWAYDSDFSKSNASGIDECFPTVAPSEYREFPWNNIKIPDHGEIWTQELKTLTKDSVLDQTVHGVRFPYVFNRKIKIDNNKIYFTYNIINLGSHDFKYIWSFHPILKLLPGTRINVNENPDMYIDFSTNSRFDLKIKKYKWPVAFDNSGSEIDFSVINDVDSGNAEKIYLDRIISGKVDLIYPEQNEKMSFKFNSTVLKHCGIWINRKGWPIDGYKLDSLAIEPCNCLSDRYEDSLKSGSFGIVKANSSTIWEIELAIID
jgi:hypothetical protein